MIEQENDRIETDVQGEPLAPETAEAVNEMAGNLDEAVEEGPAEVAEPTEPETV